MIGEELISLRPGSTFDLAKYLNQNCIAGISGDLDRAAICLNAQLPSRARLKALFKVGFIRRSGKDWGSKQQQGGEQMASLHNQAMFKGASRLPFTRNITPQV